MRRVCRPGGVVAARDSDYAAFTWYPMLPALDEWLALYRRVARAQRRRARRRPAAAVLGAGGRVPRRDRPRSSTWCFATPEDRAWWGGMWADRVLQSAMAAAGRRDRLRDREPTCTGIADGWRAWAAADDGWFSILHGEILCRV